jgi:hypothetical protein
MEPVVDERGMDGNPYSWVFRVRQTQPSQSLRGKVGTENVITFPGNQKDGCDVESGGI